MSASVYLLTVVIICTTPTGESQQALAKADSRVHQLSGFEPEKSSSKVYKVKSGTYTLTVEGIEKPRTITIVNGDSTNTVNIGKCAAPK